MFLCKILMNASFVNCCAVSYIITHSFYPSTLDGVFIGSKKYKFYRGVPEPLGTPLPKPLVACGQQQ